MSYKFLPPGSYYFWHLGSQGPYARWAFSLAGWCLLATAWYFCIHMPLIYWCTPAAIRGQEALTWSQKLGELAQADSCTATAACDTQMIMFELLTLFEKCNLAVQSSSCQKPVTKQGITTQRIACTASGTLHNLRELLHQLSASTLPITAPHITLHQHHGQVYTITTQFDCINY